MFIKNNVNQQKLSDGDTSSNSNNTTMKLGFVCVCVCGLHSRKKASMGNEWTAGIDPENWPGCVEAFVTLLLVTCTFI